MSFPGLALFYGGMVRTKNMLSMLTQVLTIPIRGLRSLVPFLGYSLAFTEGSGFTSPFLGGFSRLFMQGIDPSLRRPLSRLAWASMSSFTSVFFQMTFAAITTALAIGGFAERMKFSAIFPPLDPVADDGYVRIAHSVWFNPGPADLALGNEAALAKSGYRLPVRRSRLHQQQHRWYLAPVLRVLLGALFCWDAASASAKRPWPLTR